jgi:flagellar protein FlaG
MVTNQQEDREAKESDKNPSLELVKEAAVNVESNLNMIHDVDLKFTVNGSSGKVMVTVTDEATGEVIREIPSQEILNLASRLEEMIGLLFDEKG